MTNLDAFYDRFRSRDYTCWNHANEVWLFLRGVTLTMGIGLRSLKEIPRPVSPCLVYMTHRLLPKHVGIYVDGGLLHLASRGVEHVPLEVVTRSYDRVRYYQ